MPGEVGRGRAGAAGTGPGSAAGVEGNTGARSLALAACRG